MLRRLFISLPSISCFSRRLASVSTRVRPLRKIEAPSATECILSGAVVGVVYYVTFGDVLFKSSQQDICTEDVMQRWWHFKRPIAQEGYVSITPMFVNSPLGSWGDLNVFIYAKAEMDLNKKSISADSLQISDWLSQHGVEADGSEEGARLGLTNYLLKKMNDGVSKHVEKRCGCLVGSPPPAAAQTEKATTETGYVLNSDF